MTKEEWVAYLNRKRTEAEMLDCQKAWGQLCWDMLTEKHKRMEQERSSSQRQEVDRLIEKAVFGGPRL